MTLLSVLSLFYITIIVLCYLTYRKGNICKTVNKDKSLAKSFTLEGRLYEKSFVSVKHFKDSNMNPLPTFAIVLFQLVYDKV